MSERYFVPSQYHLHQLDRIEPTLAWQGGDFEAWQQKLRKRLRELIGGFPAERVPLDVEPIEHETTDTYERTRLVFQSEPFAEVPAHLLVPKELDAPAPAMICLQGHSPGMHISIGEARDDHERELIEGDRDFAIQAVQRGFITLAIEQRCFGERAETLQEQRSDHPCIDAAMHSLQLGRTLQGERVWDVMRAIDLLQERPDVDNSRIACMGNSGGGTVTFYAGCLEERLHTAVVSCAYCTYAHSLMRIYHCPDNYIPGILQVARLGDLAGLIAPRHLVVVAGREDSIFPIQGVREAYETSRAIFEAAGCPDNIHLVVGDGGHRFYAKESWPVIEGIVGSKKRRRTTDDGR